jgi:hypothetical protein
MDLGRRVSLPKVNERLRCPLPIDRVRHGGFDLGHEKNGAGIPGRNGCRVSNIFQPPERSTPVASHARRTSRAAGTISDYPGRATSSSGNEGMLGSHNP